MEVWAGDGVAGDVSGGGEVVFLDSRGVGVARGGESEKLTGVARLGVGHGDGCWELWCWCLGAGAGADGVGAGQWCGVAANAFAGTVAAGGPVGKISQRGLATKMSMGVQLSLMMCS